MNIVIGILLAFAAFCQIMTARKLRQTQAYASGLEVRLRMKIEDYAKARAYDNYLKSLGQKTQELKDECERLNIQLQETISTLEDREQEAILRQVQQAYDQSI